MNRLVLGIDQGSSGSRAMLLDANGTIVGYGYQPLGRIHPQPGWVEQDPHAVAASVRNAIRRALRAAGCAPHDVVACGITSQRDTVFAWDKRNGTPIGNAITWQDLRTVPLVAETNQWHHADERRQRLGQFPGPYASAMHIAWRMRHDAAFRRAADAEYLRLSLSAGWLVQALGTPAAHMLDYSLLQGMTVFDFRQRRYWHEWLDYLDIPQAALPRPTTTLSHFGDIVIEDETSSAAVPVLAMISDQQAALFGYDCHAPGEAACTHGTASFVNVVAGPAIPQSGVAKTYLAWELDGVATYSLEADTTVTGAAIRWMQEQMQFIARPHDLGPLAASVPNAAGVVFVPAFTGLGVPTEDRSARGTILGMTLDTSPAHIARAFLDSLGHQIHDILLTMQAQMPGLAIERLHIGGGIAASDVACQIQADTLGLPIMRAANTETSVRAAALLAGLGAGVWPTSTVLPRLTGEETMFEPRTTATERTTRTALWAQAVQRAQRWETE